MCRRQRGFAMLMVMALAAVAMLGAARLLGDGAVAERRAQEEELLSLRAYWAEQGHIAYAVSRLVQGPPCGGTCQNVAKRRDAVRGVLAELESGGAREWIYPEIAASYRFPVAATADSVNPLVRIVMSYPAATTAHPLIDSIWPPRRSIAAFVCFGVADPDTTCATNNLVGGSSVAYVSRTEPQ